MDRLLLVEHNLLFRDGLALLLEWRTGLSSIYARSLAEAQDILNEADHKPACVVVNLDLPEGGRDRTAQGTGWDTGAGAHQEPNPGTPGRGNRTGGEPSAMHDGAWCENSVGDGTIFMASGWPGKGHGTLLRR
jgi:hypothetical protein